MPPAPRHSDHMKTKGDVIYLTEKEWNAFKEQEHQERLAHSARVARGEITALEANREASIFKPEIFNPAMARTANSDQVIANLLSLKPRTAHGRRKSKAVRV